MQNYNGGNGVQWGKVGEKQKNKAPIFIENQCFIINK